MEDRNFFGKPVISIDVSVHQNPMAPSTGLTCGISASKSMTGGLYGVPRTILHKYIEGGSAQFARIKMHSLSVVQCFRLYAGKGSILLAEYLPRLEDAQERCAG